ncbi:MAG TPA: hypothetical protein VMU11_01015 [Verrucomicrobiae bacterium]|nr:hypothetical protein [Verrucomicrobiae bacterium]
MTDIRAERIRVLALWDAMGYPPTEAELASAAGFAPVETPIRLHRGRLVFEGREALVDEHEARERLFPRKIRKARRVARFLARLGGVRFVALCNTTALAHANDDGDLDFFIITKRGVVTQTRGWASLRYKLAMQRPGNKAKDPVCLSYFVDETSLDLSAHQLSGDDPYFRLWFVSLLPLYDDGVMREFWEANQSILARHPQAKRWIINPDLEVPRMRLRWPAQASFEGMAAWLHGLLVSKTLKRMANRDTRVIISPHVLKFHSEDGRAAFRERALETCKRYGLAA